MMGKDDKRTPLPQNDKRTGTYSNDVNDPAVQKQKPNHNLQQGEDDEATPGEDNIDDTNAA